jgi:DNA repair protein RadC
MAGRYAGPSRPGASTALLRARAATGGLGGLNDAEALELLLSRSMPCAAKANAAALLGRFGCLRRVLAADIAPLSAIVDASVALDLQLIFETTRRLAAAELPARFGVSSWAALFSYLKLTMAHCEREAFRVLFLDKKNQLVADEIMNQGTVDHAPVYPREVMRRALELGSSSVILVHYVARHIMDVMCPAPLCGPGGHCRCVSQAFGALWAHNRKHVRGASPPRPDRTGGCHTDGRASRCRNARRQVSPYKAPSQSISAASSCHPGPRGGAAETGGSHSLRASAFIRRVISA